MGGMNGEVRGHSKAEAYQKYAAFAENTHEMLPDQHPDPAHKKACKDEMVQDTETGEWVLYYHLHT